MFELRELNPFVHPILAPVLAAAVAIPLGFAAIGLTAVCAPDLAARGFGVDAPSGDARAYFYGAGARDIAIALLLLGVIARGGRADTALALAASALVPLADGAVLWKFKGGRAPQRWVHAGGAVAIIGVAGALWASV